MVNKPTIDRNDISINIQFGGADEIKINSKIIEELAGDIASTLNCETLDHAARKIRKQTKVKIGLRSTCLPVIMSTPASLVRHWTKSLKLARVPGLGSELDVDKGQYEGGFKVWESTYDLIEFISNDQTVMSDIFRRGSKLRALELGAGASLSTLALLARINDEPDFRSDFQLHIQDYNWQVLISLTVMNLTLNLPEEYIKALMDNRCIRFFHGHWRDFGLGSKRRYTLIFMSEVLYNKDNFTALHDLLDRHLKKTGYAIIATKDSYFGLTGGLYPWLDFVEEHRIFEIHVVRKNSTVNIPRSLLILKRRRCD